MALLKSRVVFQPLEPFDMGIEVKPFVNGTNILIIKVASVCMGRFGKIINCSENLLL